MTTMTLKPGIHEGVPFDQYLAIDAVNSSMLKPFRRSAQYAHYILTHPECLESDATDLGTAIHTAILEPMEFERDYIVQPRPSGNANSKAFKATNAAWVEEHKGMVHLTASEMAVAKAFAVRARKHKVCGPMLAGKGKNELTVAWIDKPTGVLCRARIDRLCTLNGYPTVLDFKSTRFSNDRQMGGQAADLLYHMQAAFYIDGLNTLAPVERRFVFAFAEKVTIKGDDIPELCQIHTREVDESQLKEGRATYREYLNQLINCRDTGVWPGPEESLDVLRLPTYAFRHGSIE